MTRSNHLHELIPGLAELDRQIERHEEGRKRATARTVELSTEWDHQLRQWRQQRQEALFAGETPPPEPAQPTGMLTSDEANAAFAESFSLVAERKKLIAGHADEAIAGLRSREQAILDGIRDGVGDTGNEQAHPQQISDAIGDVVRAHNSQSGSTRREQERWQVPTRSVDTAAILTSLTTGSGRAIQ